MARGTILNPAERSYVRRIKTLLDLYESQGQAHVAELLATTAGSLALEAAEGQRKRAEESRQAADEDLLAFVGADRAAAQDDPRGETDR